MDLIFFILVVYGLTNIIVNSLLFEDIRFYIEKKSKFFGKLINCCMCTGFWIGLGASLVLNPINPVISHLLFAFLGSATSHLIDLFAYYLEKNKN